MLYLYFRRIAASDVVRNLLVLVLPLLLLLPLLVPEPVLLSSDDEKMGSLDKA